MLRRGRVYEYIHSLLPQQKLSIYLTKEQWFKPVLQQDEGEQRVGMRKDRTGAHWAIFNHKPWNTFTLKSIHMH